MSDDGIKFNSPALQRQANRGLAAGSMPHLHHKFRWLSDDEVTEAARIVSPLNADEYESVTARQVNYCYELIAANRLVPGKTIKELAIIWGVTPESVKRHTSEAYRRFKATIRDPDEIRGAIIERLDAVMTMAMNHKRPYITREGDVIYADDPNYNAAVNAAKQISALCGLDVRKVEHTHKEYETADLSELLAKYREHKASMASIKPAVTTVLAPGLVNRNKKKAKDDGK
jgi:diphthamide synthase (EF-2-diphthine--ammonia ligase)